MEDFTSKIDQYLSGGMSSEDRILFETEMNSNESLREDVKLQLKVVAMLDDSAWLETKERVTELSKKKSSRHILVPLMKIASIVVLIMLSTYLIVHRQYSDENLYAAYYTEYPDRITTMGTSDANITEAMSDYNSGRYAPAIKAFKEFRLAGDSTFLIYETVSLTQNGEHDAAIILLESVLKTNPENSSTYQWQLILTYLAGNQGDKARVLLEEFVKNDDGYQLETAKELLKDLTSFWS